MDGRAFRRRGRLYHIRKHRPAIANYKQEKKEEENKNNTGVFLGFFFFFSGKLQPDRQEMGEGTKLSLSICLSVCLYKTLCMRYEGEEIEQASADIVSRSQVSSPALFCNL